MRSTRPFFAFAMPLITAAALAGCASSGDGATVTPYATETVASADAESSTQHTAADAADPSEVVASSVDAVAEAYSGVLNDPGQYSFTGGAGYSLNGEYEYALVEMTGDDIPELLVKALTTDHIDPIRVFSTTDGGTVVSPDDTLVSGAAGVGGYRAGVSAAPEGNRIFQTEWHSVRPEISVRGFVLRGDSLVSNGEEWEDDQRSPSGNLLNITFHPLSDRRPLETMELSSGTTGTGSGVGSNAGAPNPTPPPTPTSGNTATGTVRVLTAPELARLQGLDGTPNGEDSTHRFAVFVFDSPTTFTAKSSGNAGVPQEREVSLALLGSQTPYTSDPTGFDLDGQRMTLSFDSNGCWFPSDASMPLGQPRCSDFTRQ